jgi:site-specific DNA-cytosine methylase
MAVATWQTRPGAGQRHDRSLNPYLGQQLRSIELFTGAGGLALGTHDAGFSHAALVEWEANACNTLRINVAMKTLPAISDWRVIEEDVR